MEKTVVYNQVKTKTKRFSLLKLSEIRIIVDKILVINLNSNGLELRWTRTHFEHVSKKLGLDLGHCFQNET